MCFRDFCHGDMRLELALKASAAKSLEDFLFYVYMCVGVDKCHICIWKHSSVGLQMFGIKAT